MRKSIAAAAALVFAACTGPNGIQETATSVPHRDLTLTSSPAPSVEVASRIELATMPTTHRSKPRPAAPVRAAPEPETPVAAPAPAAPEPAVLAPTAPAPVAETPQSDPTGHELAPGATVTIIPASAGASGAGPGGGDWSEIPAARNRGGGVMIGGGHGGRCGGRGRGPVSILE